jgi:hypothetical protein
MSQRGFPHAGHIFNEEVAASQETAESQADLLVLAQKYVIDRRPGLDQPFVPVFRILRVFRSRNYGTVHIPLSSMWLMTFHDVSGVYHPVEKPVYSSPCLNPDQQQP